MSGYGGESPGTPGPQDPPGSPPPPGPPPGAQPTPPPGAQPTPPRRHRRRLLIGLVVALVVLIGGGAYGVSWYSDPQRAIGQGVANALTDATSVTAVHAALRNDQSRLTVDGRLVRDGEDAQANLRLSTRMPGPGVDVAVRTDLISSPQKVYLRAYDLPELYDAVVTAALAEQTPRDSATPGAGGSVDDSTTPDADGPNGDLQDALARAMLDALVRPAISELEGRWVEVDRPGLAALRELGPGCDRVTASLSTPERARLARTATEHPPFTVTRDLGSRNGDVGYLLTPDAEGVRALLVELRDTDLARTLASCTGTDQAPWRVPGTADIATALRGVEARVWLDRWSHQLREVTVALDRPDQHLQLRLRPRFDESVTVRAPADATPLGEVLGRLERAFSQLSQLG